MQRTDPTTVLIVPWYERKDFAKLREMSQGSKLPPSYEAWLDNAFGEMRRLLATGCALKIVTLHLDDYSAWLDTKAEVDSASARTRYIGELAKTGSELASSPVRINAPWPGYPAAH